MDRQPQGHGGEAAGQQRRPARGRPCRWTPAASSIEGEAENVRAVRPQLCAALQSRAHQLRAVRGPVRREDFQGAERKVQGVRQGVFDEKQGRSLLLDRVQRRGHSPPPPRVRPQVQGRPRAARHPVGARQGTKSRQNGREKRRAAGVAATAAPRPAPLRPRGVPMPMPVPAARSAPHASGGGVDGGAAASAAQSRRRTDSRGHFIIRP